MSNHDITLTTKGIFALDEMHYAIHPGLFPIGLVDVVLISVICYLSHSLIIAEAMIMDLDKDILKSNMHIS